MTLSKQDVAVLRVLQADLTPTRQDLAEAAGLSSTTLWRRVSELEKSGVIKGRVALVDPKKAGLDVCVLVSVSLKSHAPEMRRSFEEALDRNHHVMESFRVTGGHDYSLVVRTASVDAFEKILMDDILGHEAVANASSNVALRQTKYTTRLPL